MKLIEHTVQYLEARRDAAKQRYKLEKGRLTPAYEASRAAARGAFECLRKRRDRAAIRELWAASKARVRREGEELFNSGLDRVERSRGESLRRMAQREKARARRAAGATGQSPRARAMTTCIEVVRDEWSICLLVVIALAPLAMPIPALTYFMGTTDRSGFLETLWQVQGAALGLSLAVVLFVFQSVYGSRLGGSLRDFAEETWLFPIFYAGVLGLVLDGLVLLNVGFGAPQGWAASWATIWAALTAASLVFLFVTTIRAIDPRGLQAMRMRRAGRAIASEVEDVILRRVASVVLKNYCEQHAIEFVPLLGQAHGPASVPVRATADGVVRDIRLAPLRMVAADAAGRRLPPPRLRGEIGSPVRGGTELVWLDGGQADLAPAAATAFRVRKRERRVFKSTIDDLHEDGLLAIRTSSPSAYATVVELYEQVLLALPETWARYGQQYVGDAAGGANPFELSVQDYVERNLYDQMSLAAASDNRDIAHDALDLPIGVAWRALDLGALALSRRMIQLWVAARHPLIQGADAQQTQDLLEWSWLRLHEYTLLPESLVTDDGKPIEERQLGRDALLQVFDGCARLCKDVIDTRPADGDLLAGVNDVLDQILTHWAPEHDAPYEGEAEIAEQQGLGPAVVEELRARLARKAQLVAIKTELDDWRALQRFGLLFWIFRNIRDRGDAARWQTAWQSFVGYFGDVPRLAAILDKGIEADFNDRGRWSTWVFDAFPRRGGFQARGVAVDLEFVQTFVVLALSLIAPGGPGPHIPPLQHGRGRLDNPRETVEALVANENLAPLLPADRLDERKELLITALEAMLAELTAADEQASIDAPLDARLVDEFKQQLRDAWRSGRTLRAAFASVGGVEAVAAPLGERAGSQVKRWLNKRLFIADDRVFGADRIAADYGRGLARYEWRVLMSSISGARTTDAQASLAETIRTGLADLRNAGYAPTLIIVPMSWEIYQGLELQPVRNRGGDAVAPDWSDDNDGPTLFVGAIDGVPVIQHQHAPDDRVYIADLTRLARFRERDVADPPGPVTVDVTYYDEATLRQMNRDNRLPFEEELEEDEKVRFLLQRVFLDAVYPFEVVVADLEAARRIDVPAELLRV